MRAAPVGDDHSVESPFSAQDVVEKVFVVAAVLVLIEVVGAHDGPCAAFLDCRLECGQVDFVERAVVDYHVGVVAVDLMVVEGEVLHAGCHSVGLHSLDVGDYHGRGQIGVLSHVFEVASVERGAVDVHSGAEQHGLVAVARLLSYALAVEQGHVLVPCGGEAGECGIGYAGVIGPARLVPFVPENFGAYAVGAVRRPDVGDAETGHTP